MAQSFINWITMSPEWLNNNTQLPIQKFVNQNQASNHYWTDLNSNINDYLIFFF